MDLSQNKQKFSTICVVFINIHKTRYFVELFEPHSNYILEILTLKTRFIFTRIEINKGWWKAILYQIIT